MRVNSASYDFVASDRSISGMLFPTVQFKLSDIGEGIAEVQIKEWHVKEGDTVSQFDNLCEVQSDKAAVTITSRYDGVVKKLHYKVDDVARVGQPLLEIEVDDTSVAEESSQEPKKEHLEEAPAPALPPKPPADSSKSIIQFKLFDIGEGIAEVQIKEWRVFNAFDNLCEVQSDKAAVTITSRFDGIVSKREWLLKSRLFRHYNVNEVVRVGQPLIDFEVEGGVKEAEAGKDGKEAPTPVKAEAPSVATPQAASVSDSSEHALLGKVLATPAVRRIAMENKVDLKQVKGSGRDGRVLKEDVLKFLGKVEQDYTSGSTNIRYSPAIGTQAKTFSPLSEDRVVPIRGYTRAMIKTMTEALKIPHFGYDDEVRADALIAVRNELKELAKERNVKLSYMPFFIKASFLIRPHSQNLPFLAVSLALLEYPSLNASVDDKLENVIYKASHNICLAMDTPGGLVVPNIKNCEQRSILEIAAELQRLQEDGKRERIARDDLTGGTFTLSNIGTIGGTYVSPVIFPPQVAIGALGKVEKLPRYDHNDNLVPMNMFKVSWCADHRVVDGATMARFSNRWKFYVEHPSAMLAQLK
uniref:Dihydrolipoamide acetyltransferase component of pyruvate dehydrogenase complex n=1 Tax=Haemonchus placei TaxID=6290 RepID=A0A0N4WIN1_HAEPC